MGAPDFLAETGLAIDATAIRPHIEQGKTVIAVGGAGRVLGYLAIADKLRESSREAVARLKHMGIEVTMLTGDNAATAKAQTRGQTEPEPCPRRAPAKSVNRSFQPAPMASANR